MLSLRQLAAAVPLLVLPALASAEEYHDCVIEPFMVVEIGAAVEGVVATFEAERGKLMKKGDVIARLDSRVEQESMRISEAQAASQVGINIAEARLELAEKQAERQRELVKRKAGTVADLEIAEAELKTAVMELERAREAHMMDGLERDRMREIVERRVIRAPMDGVLLRRLIGPGEFAHSQAQIAQMAAVDPLFVDVFLPTEVYNDVKVGQMATVYPAAPIGGVYQAEISSIDQVFDAASDTFGVRLVLENPEGKLPGGVDCTLSLTPSG